MRIQVHPLRTEHDTGFEIKKNTFNTFKSINTFFCFPPPPRYTLMFQGFLKLKARHPWSGLIAEVNIFRNDILSSTKLLHCSTAKLLCILNKEIPFSTSVTTYIWSTVKLLCIFKKEKECLCTHTFKWTLAPFKK